MHEGIKEERSKYSVIAMLKSAKCCGNVEEVSVLEVSRNSQQSVQDPSRKYQGRVLELSIKLAVQKKYRGSFMEILRMCK